MSYAKLAFPCFSQATELLCLADGAWALKQDFGLPELGINITLTMFVIRLSDGTLWLHTPIAPTEEALALLKQIPGTVAHIVVPNLSPEHWCAL